MEDDQTQGSYIWPESRACQKTITNESLNTDSTDEAPRALGSFQVPSLTGVHLRRFGLYNAAKRAEYDRDIPLALSLFERALFAGDRLEFAIKEIISLLHMLGRTSEAIAFVERCMRWGPPYRGYAPLLRQLQNLSTKLPTPVHSRSLFAEACCQACLSCEDLVPPGLPAPVCSHENLFHNRCSLRSSRFLRDTFMNFLKILRVLVSTDERSGLIEFSTHSAARRALDNPPPPGFRLRWVSPETVIPDEDFTKVTTLPVFGNLADCALPAPSPDWRRPRPTAAPGNLYLSDPDTNLANVLAESGAWDDICRDERLKKITKLVENFADDRKSSNDQRSALQTELGLFLLLRS